jgi:thymidine kinase
MQSKVGFLEVIAGPMYSGKTEELIRLIKRAVIGKKHVQVFKPNLDKRYGLDKKLFSHAGISVECETIGDAAEIVSRLKKNTQMVVIDEAQWLGEALVPVIKQLLDRSLQVIISGLPLTFDRQPFVPMPTLMAMADKVLKLSAVCSICGNDAIFHKRITKEKSTVNALEPDPQFVSKFEDSIFEARCRTCFDKK